MSKASFRKRLSTGVSSSNAYFCPFTRLMLIIYRPPKDIYQRQCEMSLLRLLRRPPTKWYHVISCNSTHAFTTVNKWLHFPQYREPIQTHAAIYFIFFPARARESKVNGRPMGDRVTLTLIEQNRTRDRNRSKLGPFTSWMLRTLESSNWQTTGHGHRSLQLPYGKY